MLLLCLVSITIAYSQRIYADISDISCNAGAGRTCLNALMYCPSDEPCTIDCYSFTRRRLYLDSSRHLLDTSYCASDGGGCCDSVMYCPSGSNDCTINCSGGCNNVTIYAQNASTLYLTNCGVTDSHNQCSDMTIYCPQKGHHGIPNTCQISGDYDLDSCKIYTQDGFYDLLINTRTVINTTVFCGVNSCIANSTGTGCQNGNICNNFILGADDDPTNNPSIEPTLYPTINPSMEPTINEFQFPSNEPSVEPTIEPTFNIFNITTLETKIETTPFNTDPKSDENASFWNTPVEFGIILTMILSLLLVFVIFVWWKCKKGASVKKRNDISKPLLADDNLVSVELHKHDGDNYSIDTNELVGMVMESFDKQNPILQLTNIDENDIDGENQNVFGDNTQKSNKSPVYTPSLPSSTVASSKMSQFVNISKTDNLSILGENNSDEKHNIVSVKPVASLKKYAIIEDKKKILINDMKKKYVTASAKHNIAHLLNNSVSSVDSEFLYKEFQTKRTDYHDTNGGEDDDGDDGDDDPIGLILNQNNNGSNSNSDDLHKDNESMYQQNNNDILNGATTKGASVDFGNDDINATSYNSVSTQMTKGGKEGQE